MIERTAFWHYIREGLSIRVSFIKPDAKRSNTFLRPEDLERFLEFKEPKTILKTKDRTIYEIVENEVYMEVEEVSIEERHLLDTELAFIEIFEKGQGPTAKVFVTIPHGGLRTSNHHINQNKTYQSLCQGGTLFK